MGRPYSRVVWNGFTSGVIGLTGAAPQVGSSTAFDTKLAQVDTIAVEIDYDILTSTITFTASFQVSKDGTNWITLASLPNNPAGVAFATGTGSQVAAKIVIAVPDGAYGYPYVRCQVTTGTGVGQGSGKDDVTFLWSYVKSFNGS